MAIAEEMRRALETAFAPEQLEIRDDSERHRGHAGWREGGETHWRIIIRAPRFDGMSRIQRHREIHAALGPEIVNNIHALQIKAGA